MNNSNEFIKQFEVVLQKIGGDAYLVGGYVREKLINPTNNPKDINIVYKGDTLKLINELNNLGYEFFKMKDNLEIHKCIIDDLTVDISNMNGETIEEDLNKRDFTINAICIKLIENKVIDLFKGRNSIKSRIIQSITDKSIEDDPIRILRGIRFYIKYGMHFNLDTEDKVIKMAPKLKSYIKERIFNELMRIIEIDKDGRAFEFLDNYSILKNICPYIDELKAIEKCENQVEDVFTHMNLTYGTFKEILSGRINIDGLDLSTFQSTIGSFKVREYIAYACFMHDIGKAKCYKKIDGKVTFYDHDIEGAKIIKLICEDTNIPKEALGLIEKLIEGHMRPFELFSRYVNNEKNSSYELFNKYEEFTIPLLVLSFCDNYSTRMLFDPENEKERYKDFIENMLTENKRYIEIKEDRIISEAELINITGETESNISYLMNNIDRLRYLGQINSREDIFNYLNKR